jgi:hypothetical protein
MVSVAGETRAYDMTDRHVQTSKGSGVTLNQVVYTRDVFDRVVRRVETVNDVVTSTVKYGFTGGGDSQSFVLSDSGNTITERSMALPGGVNVAFRTGGQIGRNFRIAPFGDRTGNPLGELPHYHLRLPWWYDSRDQESVATGLGKVGSSGAVSC